MVKKISGVPQKKGPTQPINKPKKERSSRPKTPITEKEFINTVKTLPTTLANLFIAERRS